MKIGILGGGLSGLAVASFLKTDFEVLEREKKEIAAQPEMVATKQF